MRKFITSTMVFFVLCVNALAQNTTNNVPKDADLYMEFNLNAIKGHLGKELTTLNKKFDFPVFDNKRVALADLFNEPESGVNMEGKAVFFMTGLNTTWIVPISDAKQFEETIEGIANKSQYGHSDHAMEEAEATVGGTTDEEDEPKKVYAFEKSKGAKHLFILNYGVTIKKNIAILTKGPRPNMYNSGYYDGRYKCKEELKDYMREAGLTNSDDHVSPKMAAKIKEIIANYEKEQIEREKKEKEEAEKRKKEMDEETEPIDAVEVVEDEEAFEATEEAEDVPYRYSWNHVVLMEFDKQWNKFREREKERKYEVFKLELVEQAQEILSLKSKNSIASNKEFKSKFETGHDVGFFVRGDFPLSSLSGLSREFRKINFLKMSEHLQDNFSSMYLDVKGNSIDLTGNQYLGELFSQYKALETKPVNSQFLNYLPKSTFAAMSTNFNINETYDMYMDLYGKILANMDIEEGMDVSGGLDLFDMFINKDMMLNTFGGDALIALTGTTELLGTRRVYKFDTATYKSTWQTVADTSIIPEMMGMFTIKNEKNLRNLINALVKLRVLMKKGDSYVIDLNYGYRSRRSQPEKEMWTFGIEGNIFYFTNSFAVQEKEGLIKDNSLANSGSEIANLIKSTGNFFYWNHDKGVNALPLQEMIGRRNARELTSTATYFKSAKMVTTVKGNDMYKINANFKFSEENKENALLQVLHMMQAMNGRR